MNQGLIDIIESRILIDPMILIIKNITGDSIPLHTGNAYLKQYIIFSGKFSYNINIQYVSFYGKNKF